MLAIVVYLTLWIMIAVIYHDISHFLKKYLPQSKTNITDLEVVS